MAVKSIGYAGRKVLPEMTYAMTQDFLFVNNKAILLGDVTSYPAQAKLVVNSISAAISRETVVC